MSFAYDHERTLAARSAFFARQPLAEKTGLRPEVLASWERSRASGLSPDRPPQALSPASPAAAAGVNIRRSFFLGPDFHEFTDCLCSVGAAYLLLYEDLTVFYLGGDPALLARLSNLGIDEGTSFSEEHMGTNAAFFAAQNRNDSWIIGAEHYLDSLEPYATYACWSHEKYSKYLFCIVVPKEQFSEPFVGMSRSFHKIRRLSEDLHRTASDLARQQELFNQLKDIQEEGLMLVDFSQKIIGVNKQFESWFELSQDDVIQRDLTEILPELENMMICLRTGKSITLSETHFEGLPAKRRTMYVNCTPWKRNGIINGMVLSFSNSKRLLGDPSPPACHTSYTFDDLIGESPAFREIKEMARGVAGSNSSVILTGESGTGKELFARAIHNESGRRKKAFVAVNCSAIPKELIGSELFGYGDGAFTGARKGGAMGKFEYAHGGTLFLDEVAELPSDVQAILLRVLEERAVVRIGTNAVVPVDVRIIAATNKNLLQMVKENTFRLDLYYRLNVIALELPPLRMRTGDIPLLVDSFLESMSRSLGKEVTSVSAEVMDCLTRHEWPGNIRQLRNVVERGINMAASSTLRLGDLPQEITAFQYPPAEREIPANEPAPRTSEHSSYEDWERQKIWELMQKYRANKSRIAEEMGISRGTLYKKIQRYGL